MVGVVGLVDVAQFESLHGMIKTVFVPSGCRVATKELEKACARVQPEKSSCMVPHDIVPTLVDKTRELNLIVTGTHTRGAPLAMDLSMDGTRRRRSGGGPGGGCARMPVGTPSPPRAGRWKPRSRAMLGTVGG
jgi:hypothetical protein